MKHAAKKLSKKKVSLHTEAKKIEEEKYSDNQSPVDISLTDYPFEEDENTSADDFDQLPFEEEENGHFKKDGI